MLRQHYTHYDPYQDAEDRDIHIFETPISHIKGYYQRTGTYVRFSSTRVSPPPRSEA
ncbi:MAG: hypothetical protein QME41_06715 [Actinomycetota bacterium]|nr:hypothetical protein [Actinomycetota bacterium]